MKFSTTKNGNFSMHWNIMAEKILKKVLVWPCKNIWRMVRILGVRTKVICFKNINKFCDNGSIFAWFLGPNKCRNSRTNFKLSHNNILNNGTIMRTKPFRENSSNNKNRRLEHIFKSYYLICIKYIYIQAVYSYFDREEIKLFIVKNP